MKNEISTGPGGTMYAGPKAMDAFQAIVIASGLKMYAKTGMKPNRMYTPKNMMAMAMKMTGQKFKARDYVQAADALELLARKLKGEVAQEMKADATEH